ncbi:MAG: PfkB family carbohydrate kinase [Clostridia bacterium]|nr:PfkB family carbohydrate kinase [Clostridia bacterium]
MKKILVIGSTCLDVIIRTPKIPVSREDVNIDNQSFALGGCAFNVARAIDYSGGDYLLFSPIGTGIFGDYIKNEIKKTGIKRADLYPDEPNGSCYCIVEPNGERSFLCEHGAEYWFKKEWFDSLDPSEFAYAYICGLEMEEDTAPVVLDFLEKANLQVFFAPGPRMHSIKKEVLDRIIALKPILHLNKDEAAYYLKERDFVNDYIVTDGEKGATYVHLDGKEEFCPGEKVKVVDTIGAGDFHIGTFLAERSKGMDVLTALRKANHISAKVVSHEGASPE